MPVDPQNSSEYAKKFAIPGERFHSVTQFGANTYKITQFYGLRQHFGPGPVENHEHSDVKLSSSISRTRRRILELALANDWDYFITMTLDENKVPRFDLEAWHKKFNEWLKYRRKAYGLKISYLLVPEQHGDGAWHAHGLIRGVPADELAGALVGASTMFWTADGGLSVLGVLAIAGLGISLILLLVALLVNFLRFR